MPGGFVGRFTELDRLSALLGRVGDPARDLPGVAVALRGRRRVGKSRLVEVFCEHGIRMGKIRAKGAMKNIPLELLTDAERGDRVLICDGVAIGKALVRSA